MTQPRRRDAIVICCDRNYFPYAAFLAEDVAARKGDGDYDILICSVDDLVAPGNAPPPYTVLKIDLPEVVSAWPLTGRLPPSTYLRLFVPGVIADRYRRIAYLDVDVSLVGGDLATLFRIDMKGACIAAARNRRQIIEPDYRFFDHRDSKDPDAPYFNAGILVIDVDEWMRRDVLSAASDLIASGRKFEFHDQSALNILFRNDWAEISPVWNWPHFGRLGEGPNIVHFIGKLKGWMPTRFGPWRREAARYRRFLAERFGAPPLRPAIANDVNAVKRVRQFRRSSGLVERYMRDFPKDDVVRHPPKRG